MTGPIGVFDSGVGGLTVLKALRRRLPAADFIYLGDTARLPYGTKSADTVVRYSTQCAAALVARGIGCLVVACNTASASALDTLRRLYPAMPVIGVIEPGAAAAVAVTQTRHIAVIATEGTVNGGAYAAAIHRIDAGIEVSSRACGLFVAMAEEGWNEGPIAAAVARRYLQPLFAAGALPPPDTLVLGCTHFPVLAATIAAVLPAGVHIVDSAQTTATAVERGLRAAISSMDARGVDAPGVDAPGVDAPGVDAPGVASQPPRGRVTWLATDNAARFARIGGLFLGEPLHVEAIELVDL